MIDEFRLVVSTFIGIYLVGFDSFLYTNTKAKEIIWYKSCLIAQVFS